jgi:signal recognition particle GTPase
MVKSSHLDPTSAALFLGQCQYRNKIILLCIQGEGKTTFIIKPEVMLVIENIHFH